MSLTPYTTANDTAIVTSIDLPRAASRSGRKSRGSSRPGRHRVQCFLESTATDVDRADGTSRCARQPKTIQLEGTATVSKGGSIEIQSSSAGVPGCLAQDVPAAPTGPPTRSRNSTSAIVRVRDEPPAARRPPVWRVTFCATPVRAVDETGTGAPGAAPLRQDTAERGARPLDLGQACGDVASTGTRRRHRRGHNSELKTPKSAKVRSVPPRERLLVPPIAAAANIPVCEGRLSLRHRERAARVGPSG